MPTSSKKKGSALKIILLVWLVFTSLYFVWGEYQRLSQFVFQQGVEQGRFETTSGIIQAAQACQPFSVYIADQKVDLLNVNCLSAVQPASEPVLSEEADDQ